MRPGPADAQSFLPRRQPYGGPGPAAADEPKERWLPNSKAVRLRLNVVPMVQSLLFPWLLFCLVFGVLSFDLHYFKPTVCYLVVTGCAALVIACGLIAYGHYTKRRLPVDPNEPTWTGFVFATMLVAWLLGVLLGEMNFATHLQSHYDYSNLNDYSAVDPALTPGQQLMDAGRIQFTNSSALDLRRSMGFRNLDTYCVAPISTRLTDGVMPALATYDFWAVGLNCCSGNAADFHCGEYGNPDAHSGLRLLKDDQRAFFRLAVQQATAAYNIKAVHPLFFFWVEDPAAEMESYRASGYKYYLIGILVHFGWQLLCVALAALGFAKSMHS